MIPILTFVLALSALTQDDVDAAYSYCYAKHTVCADIACSSAVNSTKLLECRQVCRAAYEACKEDIQKAVNTMHQ